MFGCACAFSAKILSTSVRFQHNVRDGQQQRNTRRGSEGCNEEARAFRHSGPSALAASGPSRGGGGPRHRSAGNRLGQDAARPARLSHNKRGPRPRTPRPSTAEPLSLLHLHACSLTRRRAKKAASPTSSLAASPRLAQPDPAPAVPGRFIRGAKHTCVCGGSARE